MRTSGEDRDTALFLFPVAVLAIIVTIWFGGPTQTFRAIDAGVLDAIHWLRTQW